MNSDRSALLSWDLDGSSYTETGADLLSPAGSKISNPQTWRPLTDLQKALTPPPLTRGTGGFTPTGADLVKLDEFHPNAQDTMAPAHNKSFPGERAAPTLLW